MQMRRLGREGLEVSALGLGCMAMTPLYGPVDEAEAMAAPAKAARSPRAGGVRPARPEECRRHRRISKAW